MEHVALAAEPERQDDRTVDAGGSEVLERRLEDEGLRVARPASEDEDLLPELVSIAPDDGRSDPAAGGSDGDRCTAPSGGRVGRLVRAGGTSSRTGTAVAPYRVRSMAGGSRASPVRFQIRTVSSTPYVTNSAPSGPNASPWTPPLCPSSTAQDGSAAASGQTRIGFWVPALTTLAMTRPPGLSAATAASPQPPSISGGAVGRRRSQTPIQP